MSKSRLAAGCYFQTGDGAATAGVAGSAYTLTATGSPTGGTQGFLVNTGYNAGVQPNAGSVLSVAFGETAASLQTKLDALVNVGKNAAGLSNALAAGGPWPATPLTVTYQNDLLYHNLVNWLQGVNGLTGGASPAGTVTLATPATPAGENFSNISELLTLPFPQVKRAKKEVTNFDSLNFTKEFIPEFIDPGDVKIDANFIGDTTQDQNNGLIGKFNQGLIYTCQINIPNYTIGPGVFVKGHLERYKGFFTDAALSPAKVTDVLMITGTLGITGAVSYLAPVG